MPKPTKEQRERVENGDMSNQKTTVAAQKDTKGNQNLLLKHETRILSPEELKAYSEIYPDFGKEYLINQIEIPREVIKEGKRTQKNVSIGVFVSLLVVVLYFSCVFWLFHKEQFTAGATILCGGILSTIVTLLLKSKINPFKEE